MRQAPSLSTRMARKIVKKWVDYSRLGYRQAQMMSKHKDPKTDMRYDHGRENPDQNAVNFLGYDDEG
jgi:hypothetical protein